MPAERSAELTLRWDAGVWRVAGAGLDLAHADLAALDALIIDALARTHRARKAHVRFDMSRLPVWLRQYQAHYFNYVLHVERGERK